MYANSLLKTLNNVDTSAEQSEGRKLLNELKNIVEQCEDRYAGKKELATEDCNIVMKLCELLESVVCHGLKTPRILGFTSKNPNDFPIWDFCESLLTKHEMERFNSIKQVKTKQSKLNALIRTALNEHSLERYISTWLDDPRIKDLYEPWSLMIDEEVTKTFPSVAAKLNSILFAINIENVDKNKAIRKNGKKEPIIYAPAPVKQIKRTNPVKRHILSLNDDPIPNSQVSIEQNVDPDLPHGLGYHDTTYISNDSCENSTDDDLLIPGSSLSSENICSTPSTSSSEKISTPMIYTSTTDETDVCKLKDKLKEATDTCARLERRITELVLENRRLQQLVNMSANGGAYLATISHVMLMQTGCKKFYTYQIHMNCINTRQEWQITRRYSDFLKLHNDMLRMSEYTKALDFPPKKKIGNMNSAFVEERRQRLQIYLRNLLAILPEISSCRTKEELQDTFSFFK